MAGQQRTRILIMRFVFFGAVLFAVIYPLYEVSIWIIVYFEKQAEKQAKLDGTWEEPDEE